jgi:hypothetical protein
MRKRLAKINNKAGIYGLDFIASQIFARLKTFFQLIPVEVINEDFSENLQIRAYMFCIHHLTCPIFSGAYFSNIGSTLNSKLASRIPPMV